MKNKIFIVITLLFYSSIFQFVFAESNEMSFEEFQAFRKKEREEREGGKGKRARIQRLFRIPRIQKQKVDGNLEEAEFEKKKKAGKVAYSPWAVYYTGTSGNIKGSDGRDGITTQFQVGGFRIGFGIFMQGLMTISNIQTVLEKCSYIFHILFYNLRKIFWCFSWTRSRKCDK